MLTKEQLEQIKEYLSYNAETGIMTWRKSPGRRRNEGAAAGTLEVKGYIRIKLKGYKNYAHRMAWFLYYGNWPEKDLDHINGIRDDNRIENLKEVSNRENSQNRVSHRNGKLFGCYFHKQNKKWYAQIRINGKIKYIGLFNTEQEAHEAYKNYITKQELG